MPPLFNCVLVLVGILSANAMLSRDMLALNGTSLSQMLKEVTSSVAEVRQMVVNASDVACNSQGIPYGRYIFRSPSTGKFLSYRAWDGGAMPDAELPYAWDVAQLNVADNDGTVDGAASVIGSCGDIRRTISAPNSGQCELCIVRLCPKWDQDDFTLQWVVMYSCTDPPAVLGEAVMSKTLWFLYPDKARACGASFAGAAECIGVFELVTSDHILEATTRAISSTHPGLMTPQVLTPEEWGGWMDPWDKGSLSQAWEVWQEGS